MDILYIDIYFLINLTVDMLSLYFASIVSKAPTNKIRLFSVSAILSIIASVSVLFEKNPVAAMLFFLLSSVISFAFSISRTSFVRRVRFFAFFMITLMLFGGIVNLVFGILSNYIPDEVYDTVDRRFLVLSLTILLCIAIIKMVCALFASENNTKMIRVKLELMGRKIFVDSLVDSGNLLKDPIDLTPVMLLKSKCAEELLPDGVPSVDSAVTSYLGKYIRLIPIKRNGKCEIEVGIRTESASVFEKGRETEIKLTFIIDKEGGSFGGYQGLIPAAALDGK